MKKVVIILAALMMLFIGSLTFTSVEKTYWEWVDTDTKMYYVFDRGEAYFVLADYFVYPISSWNDYVFYWRGFCFMTVHSGEGDYGFLVSIFYGEKGGAAELGWYKNNLFLETYTIKKIDNMEVVKNELPRQ